MVLTQGTVEINVGILDSSTLVSIVQGDHFVLLCLASQPQIYTVQVIFMAIEFSRELFYISDIKDKNVTKIGSSHPSIPPKLNLLVRNIIVIK